MKGARFSECPAEFLDLLAGAFDYFARKAEENDETTTSGKPVAPYKRKDAARARGWAKRIRAGYAVDRSTGELTEAGGATNAMPASTFDESEWPAEPVSELTDATFLSDGCSIRFPWRGRQGSGGPDQSTKPRYRSTLQQLAGKRIEFVIRKPKSKRSLDMNAYLHSTNGPFRLLAEHFGEDLAGIKYALAGRVLRVGLLAGLRARGAGQAAFVRLDGRGFQVFRRLGDSVGGSRTRRIDSVTWRGAVMFFWFCSACLSACNVGIGVMALMIRRRSRCCCQSRSLELASRLEPIGSSRRLASGVARPSICGSSCAASGAGVSARSRRRSGRRISLTSMKRCRARGAAIRQIRIIAS
jgi:hypothetical protein